MALRRSTARRYAEAAFEIAVRDDSVEAWLAALTAAEERLSDERVARILASPAVPVAARVELLDRLLGESATSGAAQPRRAPHPARSLRRARRGRPRSSGGSTPAAGASCRPS